MILDSPGDFEIQVQRGTSGTRVHRLRAKTSESAARWIDILTERPLADMPVPVNQPDATAAALVPAVAAATVSSAPRGAWRPVVGVPLDALLTIEERQGSVPVLVAAVVNLLAAEAGSCSPDLFDGTGSAPFVFAAKAMLEAGQDPTSVLAQAPDPRKAAGSLLLKFLWELPDPLCTESRCLAFLSAVDAPVPLDGLREIVADLPEQNSTLLLYLVTFLKLLSQHQDESGLTTAVLSRAIGPAICRELVVLPGAGVADSKAPDVVTMLMEHSSSIWAETPSIIQMPAFQNLTWKLLLVGRLLRLTPDEVERKLTALEELATLDKALDAAQQGGAANQVKTISTKRDKVRGEFYQLEVACAAGNVAFADDKLAVGLLHALRDHLELIKQEELSLRATFRKCCVDKDRPSVDQNSLRSMLEHCARTLQLGDFMLDSHDMFTEIFFLRGEKKRAFSLPEFLDVLGKWMELYGLFRKHDKFKDGHVSVNCMVEAMEEFGALMGYRPTPFHVMQLCDEFDIDAEYGVTWEEFRLVMHRWIEERKQGVDIGKGPEAVETIITDAVLDTTSLSELKTLFTKFCKTNGTLDVLELGSMFEEICYTFNLGGTLADLFRLFRAVEVSQEIKWPQFVSIMGKQIILKRLFVNFSKDRGHTVLVDDLEYLLADLRDVWGCFDPRYGNGDLQVMAREVAASVNTPMLSFEEFVAALRFQVAFKVIFELNDPGNTGTLPYNNVMVALRSLEDYCGISAAFSKAMTALDASKMDTDVHLSWSEFLVVAHVAVGDEYDGSY